MVTWADDPVSDDEKCPMCNGTGKTRNGRKCLLCNGTGRKHG